MRVLVLSTLSTVTSCFGFAPSTPPPIPADPLQQLLNQHSLEFKRVGANEIRSQLEPLLRNSYVATPDDSLRLDYSARDLLWMLDAPDADANLRVGIGKCGESSLIGFVCAAPCNLHLNMEQQSAVEVSLLCVHRDWRGLGLTKLMLFELRKRARLAGLRCSIFTEVRPKYTPPLVRADCHHRPLRARELLRSGFWQLDEQQKEGEKPPSARQLQKAIRLPKLSSIASKETLERLPPSFLRAMKEKDIDGCHKLIHERCVEYPLAPDFTREQFKHRFKSGNAKTLVLRRRRQRHSLWWHFKRLFRKRRGANGLPIADWHLLDKQNYEKDAILGWASFILLPLKTKSGERLVQAQMIGWALQLRDDTKAVPEYDVRAQYGVRPLERDPVEVELENYRRVEPLALTLLDGLLRLAHKSGAHVVNAHAIAELAERPSFLSRLGFGKGDEDAYVCIDPVVENKKPDASGAPGSSPAVRKMLAEAPLEPSKVGWLPLL